MLHAFHIAALRQLAFERKQLLRTAVHGKARKLPFDHVRIIHERAGIIKTKFGEVFICIQHLEASLRKSLAIRGQMVLRARGAIIPKKPARKQRIVPPAHLLGQEHAAGPQHAKQLVGAVCAMAAKRNIKRIVCKRQRFLCGVAFLHMNAERCKLVAVAFHIRPPGFRGGVFS